jgi:surface antigen
MVGVRIYVLQTTTANQAEYNSGSHSRILRKRYFNMIVGYCTMSSQLRNIAPNGSFGGENWGNETIWKTSA